MTSASERCGAGVSATEVSIVVPVYRNRETIRELTRRLHQALDGRWVSHRIVFVNDACPSGSGELLDQVAATDCRVFTLHLGMNRGQHRAVLAGLAQCDSEWIVVMDADLQDPPEAVPALLEAARESGEIIFGGRRGRYESGGRLLTSSLYRLFLPLIAGIPRDAGMFFAAPGTVASTLCSLETPSPHVVVMLGFTEIQTCSLPVERSRCAAAGSAYNSFDRLRSALWAFRTALHLRLTAVRRRSASTAPSRID